MVIAFAAAGKVACVFTSVAHQILVWGTQPEGFLSPQFPGVAVEEQVCLQGARTV